MPYIVKIAAIKIRCDTAQKAADLVRALVPRRFEERIVVKENVNLSPDDIPCGGDYEVFQGDPRRPVLLSEEQMEALLDTLREKWEEHIAGK